MQAPDLLEPVVGSESPHRRVALYRRPWVVLLGAFVIYGLIALVAYWPLFPGDSSRMPGCACGDQAQEGWFISWIPFALSHGLNPLFSGWLNFPYGVNLAQNTSMPLLGLLTAPLTTLVSPIASYNLLLWLAFPASGTAMFAVVRKWTGSTAAAVIAGLLYGFSAYTIGQGFGHVMLSFVPLPPLYFYQLHKIVAGREGSPRRQGLVLGLIAVAQYFIAQEILATLIIVTALGLIVLAGATCRRVSRALLRRAATGLIYATGVVAVFVAYPLWFAVSGADHASGSVRPVINATHVDLFGPVLPTHAQRFAPHRLIVDYASKFSNVEDGSYIGAPLLLLAILLAVRYRSNRWIRLCAVMAAVAFLLSLGPRLSVLTHKTSVPLPFALLARFPLLDNLVADRLSLYEVLFVSLAVALGIAELIRDVRSPSLSRRARHAPTRRANPYVVAAVAALGVLTAVSLIPRWPYHTVPTATPSLFRSTLVKQIPLDSAVLAYPFPYGDNDQSMLWQAVADMRFKQPGGFAYMRGKNGKPTLAPANLDPTIVQRFLVTEETTQTAGTAEVRPPPVTNALAADLRTYLARYHIRAVIEDPGFKGSADVSRLFSEALGPPQLSGGVEIWLQMPGQANT